MKRLLLLTLLALCLALPADAQFYTRQGSPNQDFSCGLATVGAALEECKAIPSGSTQRYHITQIVVQSTTSTANQYSIQSGTGTACATTTTAVFPAASTSVKYTGVVLASAPNVINFFPVPLHVTAGHAICVLGIATQLTNITITGYVQ